MASSDAEIIRSSVREFAESVLRPVARRIDAENSVPEDIIRKTAEMGYFSMRVPEEYGGPGLSVQESVIVVEELARVSSAVAIMAAVSGSMVATPLLYYASDDLKEKYLKKLAE